MIYYIRHEKFSKWFSSLSNALGTVNQAEINMNSKIRDSLFKLGRYNRVFLELWAHISIWAPMLKWWAVGSLFSQQYSRRAHKDPQKFYFFIKTSKWEKWWSGWHRITNAFILCNLLWKVQKSFAANREGIFKELCINIIFYLTV